MLNISTNFKTIITFSGLPNIILQLESKGLSNQKFQPPYTTLKLKLVWMNNSRMRIRFGGSCLKQEGTTPFTSSNVVNLFVVY